MSSPIYELYEQYKNKGIDDDFINKAYELMIQKEPELVPFVNNFKIEPDGEGNIASYSMRERIIRVDRDLLRENLDAEPIKNDPIFTLRVVRHELEHARDLKKLHEGKDDIESAIIKIALRDYAIDHGLERFDFYDKTAFFMQDFNWRRKENRRVNPEERLADIRAWKYLVNLLKNQRTTQDLLIAKSKLYYAFIHGYQENPYFIEAPTYRFMLNMGMYHQYYLFKKRVEEKNEYSFYTRLMYGLPLKQEEFDRQILKTLGLQKRKK